MARFRANILMAVRLITGLLCFAAIETSAQDKPVYAFGAAAHGGWIWAHTKPMRHLVTDYVTSYELSIARKSSGEKSWERKYRQPDYGLAFLMQDFNNDLLGHSLGIVPYVDFPILKGKRSSFNFRSGTGFIYLTKPFDADDNFRNISIGSHINTVIQYAAIYRHNLSDRLAFDSGITFTHFSNGGNRYPNLGINVPTLRLGMSWNTGALPPLSEKLPGDTLLSKRVRLSALAAVGLKGIDARSKQQLPIYTLALQCEKPITFKSGLLLSADAFYSTLLAGGYQFDSTNPSRDALRIGLSAHYLLTVGDLSYHYGLGVYVYSPYKGDGFMYHRIGLRYRFWKELAVNVSLKTHFAVADNLELGLAWRFR